MILRKVILIGLGSGLEINLLLEIPLFQCGAVMRATISFLFPKCNKLGVESFHDTYFLRVDFVTFTATALRTTFLADDDLVMAIFCD